MFRMYANNSHRYTLMILPLGIVRELKLWSLLLHKYSGNMTLTCLLILIGFYSDRGLRLLNLLLGELYGSKLRVSRSRDNITGRIVPV